jgi:hypothetical protein
MKILDWLAETGFLVPVYGVVCYIVGILFGWLLWGQP